MRQLPFSKMGKKKKRRGSTDVVIAEIPGVLLKNVLGPRRRETPTQAEEDGKMAWNAR